MPQPHVRFLPHGSNSANGNVAETVSASGWLQSSGCPRKDPPSPDQHAATPHDGLEPILQDCCVAANVCYEKRDRIGALVASASEDTNILSNAQRYAALVGAVIVALGFVPVPLTNPSLPKATWFEWSIAVLPLLPLAILAVSVVSRRRIPVVFAAILALVFSGAGAFVTILMSALSGGGTEMVILHGTALTIACATSFLLISTVGQKTTLVAFGAFVFPVLVGGWSIAMVPLAYSSAVEVSSSRAFCIGEHSPIQRELGSIIGLRGLSFYTTRSGYKIGDTWYFHGVLLVEEDGGLNVFSWSPSNMSFQVVERPQSLIASPFNACQPKNRFLQELNVI